jgi:hypothetical protein
LRRRRCDYFGPLYGGEERRNIIKIYGGAEESKYSDEYIRGVFKRGGRTRISEGGRAI